MFGLAVSAWLINAVLDIPMQQYSRAAFDVTLAAVVLAVGWFMERVAVWTDALIREASAKAAFAELLLTKMRAATELELAMGVAAPDAAPGTKH